MSPHPHHSVLSSVLLSYIHYPLSVWKIMSRAGLLGGGGWCVGYLGSERELGQQVCAHPM